MPAIRGGYQELHYTYLWSSLANVVVMAALLWVSSGTPGIATFFLALSGPLLMAMLLDASLLSWQRPFLVRGRASLALILKELGPNAANVLAAQASYFAMVSLPVVILAHLADPIATAGLGSVMQLLMLCTSGMNLIFQPLIPAIANAYAHGDRRWIRRAYGLGASVVCATCLIILLAAALRGPQIVHLWLGENLALSNTLTGLLGLYFAVSMSSAFHLNILTAMGRLKRVGRAYLTEGFLSVSLGVVLTRFFGPEGMAAALVLAVLCVTGWYMPYRTLRLLGTAIREP
jgi:O-antigen/teichoic acid export membrane protein